VDTRRLDGWHELFGDAQLLCALLPIPGKPSSMTHSTARCWEIVRCAGALANRYGRRHLVTWRTLNGRQVLALFDPGR